MSIQPKPGYSSDDYLAAERECLDEKHEYVAGQVFAMVGANIGHDLITANLPRGLGNRLEGSPCIVLSSDMRLRIQAADACCYPDVMVLCGKPELHDQRQDVLSDATLVAEVPSPSTEGYDRGGKFASAAPCPAHVTTCSSPRMPSPSTSSPARPDNRWPLDAYTEPSGADRQPRHRQHTESRRDLKRAQSRSGRGNACGQIPGCTKKAHD